MKNIHQTIFETLALSPEAVTELIGAGDISGVARRQDRMRQFLANNKWDLVAYNLWARAEKPLPPKRVMVGNLISAGVQAARSGAKKVSEQEQQRRLNICITECEWYRQSDKRCARCGCFTAYKSTLEAWHCPVGKW